MKKENFPKNTTIINENDKVNNFYIISKGKILVIKNNNLVREIDEGNCFGEFYLLNDEKSSEKFITYTDTQCYILSKETFFNFLIDENMNDYIKKKMCLEDNSIQLKDLFHICVLGKGRFGTVCLVHNTISLYAIKIIPKVYFENDKQMQKYLLTEKKIMLSLDYPLIIKLVKTLKTDNLCFFLLEFINGINLEDLISSKVILKNIPEVTFFAACISLILDYLNKNHIIHRDIKPSNILINKNGYYKITDFGTSKIIKDFTFTSLGTPNYMAPEILIGKGYSYPADYFSFGVCLFFMYYGKYPFGEGKKEIMDIYDDILHKNIVFPNNESNVENLNNFISNLLNKNPINRPCSLYRIKNFSFFNKFEWNLLETFKMKPPFKLKNSEIKNENNCLKNKRTLFLDFISKNKFENSLLLNKNNSYDTKRDYSNWFDIF
jgi:cGMP-dependent protein kinase